MRHSGVRIQPPINHSASSTSVVISSFIRSYNPWQNPAFDPISAWMEFLPSVGAERVWLNISNDQNVQKLLSKLRCKSKGY